MPEPTAREQLPPVSEQEAGRIVFIGGLHRSGTTLLAKILQDHPEVSGFTNTGAPMDEGQHLQDVYPPASVFGGPGRFGFEPESFLDEHSPLATDANARRLYAQWAEYWGREGAWLLEKSPPNLVRTRFLQALFPGARFVIVLRHPVAVAYATRKWARTSIRSLIEHWVVCHERFFNDREHLKKCLVIKYEDLIDDTQATMQQIWQFLELKPHPSSRTIRKGVNDRYFKSWRRASRLPIISRRTERTIKLLEPRVEQFGYSLRDPK